jgi:hypothetical protein
MEIKEQYQIRAPNRFDNLERLENEVGINMNGKVRGKILQFRPMKL